MKKKIFTILIAFMFLFGIAGQAMAYFDDSHLFRVVYERGGTKEIVTDLGAGYDKTTAWGGNKLFNTNNFSLSGLDTTSWNNVYVAYFMNDGLQGAQQVWVSGNMTSQSANDSQYSAFRTNFSKIQQLNQPTGDAQNINLQADLKSYKNTMGSQGRFTSLLPFGYLGGDMQLNGFAAVGSQYVDQKLYYYPDGGDESGGPGLKVYTIRTYEGGTTEINPVPVPAAVYLLGTGLVGLIGIRRKMASA